MRVPNGKDRHSSSIIPVPQIRTVQEWMWAEIPEADYLIGEVFSTTSRAMLSATTGLGKTIFCMALALAIAEGSNFLRWQARRDGPAKVLYIDGEMSRRLMKQRIADTVRRAGFDPDSVEVPEFIEFFCFDVLKQRPPPLNNAEGQEYFDRFIEHSGYEFVIFDNIQCLLSGSMAEEDPWKAVVPWTYSLTQRGIGQLWVHHTGHNKSRPYGTSTREWQMDTSILLEGIEQPGTDIAFKLRFLKARERRPDNRTDFEPVIITLERDRWLFETVKKSKTPGETAAPPSKPKPPSPLAMKSYDALNDAIIVGGRDSPQSAGRLAVSQEQWTNELTRLGIINGEKPDSKRALISKFRRELLAANWVACNDGLIWNIKG